MKMKSIGISQDGDLQKALNLAIKDAQAKTLGQDMIIDWNLIDVSGQAGGISGKNDLTVTIESNVLSVHT